MTPSTLTARELGDALTDDEVRGITMIQLALAGGVVMFGAVIVFLAMTSDHAPDDAGPLNIICLVAGLLFLSCAGVGQVLFGLMLTPDRLPAAEGPARAAAAVDKLKVAIIVRLALLEGPALLGLVAALLAINAGRLPAEPVYALTALPALAFVAFAAVTMPTRERLLNVLTRRFTASMG